jgi:hypothetical protein
MKQRSATGKLGRFACNREEKKYAPAVCYEEIMNMNQQKVCVIS